MKLPFVQFLSLLRWPARPTLRAAAPMLFGALVLTGCGGGNADTPATMPAAAIAASATTAPTIPVKRQPLYDTRGDDSYADAVQNYNHVGEALHGQ